MVAGTRDCWKPPPNVAFPPPPTLLDDAVDVDWKEVKSPNPGDTGRKREQKFDASNCDDGKFDV